MHRHRQTTVPAKSVSAHFLWQDEIEGCPSHLEFTGYPTNYFIAKLKQKSALKELFRFVSIAIKNVSLQH